MSLNADMKQEMQRPYFVSAFLFKISLSSYTIRIIDGAGEVRYGQEVYRGSDPTYGRMLAVDQVQEQIGTEAPLTRMKLLPESVAAAAAITNPAEQGAPVSIHWAVISTETGAVIGEPFLVMSGELDAAEFDTAQTETNLTIDVTSVWDRLFINGEGRRLNNANHQRVWAERAAQERGFEYVVAIQRQEPWGYDAPRPSIVADVIGGNPASGGGSNPGGGGSGGGSGGGFPGGGGGRTDMFDVIFGRV